MKSIPPLLCLLALATLSQAQDFEAPMVTSISVTPSVDVSAGPADVTVTVEITDDESGFQWGNIILYRPDGQFVSSHLLGSGNLTEGDDLSGTYEITVPVPQYAGGGTWEVRMFVQDNEQNLREYDPVYGENFPIPTDAEFTVVNTGAVDSAAPALVSVNIAPVVIDTGSLGQEVTLTMNLTDALSGLRTVSVSFYDPSGLQTDVWAFASPSNAVSGDALDGTYELTATIPQGSEEGTWTIRVFTRDNVGNADSVLNPAGGTFEVSNSAPAPSGGLGDAVDATQYPWVTSGDQDWHFQTATTYDGIDAARSGAIGDNETSDLEVTLEGPGTLNFYWKVDSEEDFDFLSVEVLGGGDSDAISGGVDWTQSSVEIPEGTQTVRFRYEKDGGGSAGADAGWVDRVYFAAQSDMEEPVIQYLNISPVPVDISGGDTQVTVTIEVSDDYNGFSEGMVYLYDPAGTGYTSYWFDSIDLISGDGNFGTYEFVLDISASDFVSSDPESPPYVELGSWRLEAEITEASTNTTRYYGQGNDPFPIPAAALFAVSGTPSGAGPFLTSINSITPGVVDVTSGMQNVTFNFTIVDNNTGFADGGVSLHRVNGGFLGYHSFDGAQRISGNDSNGVYEVTIPIYPHTAPGTWWAGFSLGDYENNIREYPFGTSFPNPGDEEFMIVNNGTVDTEDPVLQSISFTPSVVDTSGGMQSVTVDFLVTDNLSGLDRVHLAIYDPSDNFVSDHYTSFYPAGALSSPLQVTLDLPMGSEEGVWRCTVSAYDRVGNSIFLTPTGFSFGTPFPDPGAAQFTVGPVSETTFGAFMGNSGLIGPDALPGANPDNDSFNNVLELLLGLDPEVYDPPDPAIYSATRVGDELRIDFTLDPALVVTTNGDFLEVRADGRAPVLVTGQTGSNLIDDWVNQLPVSTGGTSYRVSLPIVSPGNGALRLEFTAP